MSLISLMSCSNDTAEELAEVAEPAAYSLEVKSYVTGYDEKTASTRAWEPPSGFSLNPDPDQKIGICFTKPGEEPKIGQFFKSGSQWRTNVEIASGEITTPFYLYGYTPHLTGMSCTISSSATPDDNSSYDEGAVLTLSNVPTVTTNDLCVVVGAKNGKTEYSGVSDYTVTGLRKGTFSYEAAAIDKESGGSGNYVFLLFDHLYASLSVRLRVHSDYTALRTIKLKNLKLKTKTSSGTMKEKATITVTLAATEGSNPISSIVFTPTGTAENDASFFHSSEGMTLTTEYQLYTSYFLPQGITELSLTSTYDVYDRKGNLIRANCEATNNLLLSNLIAYFDMVRTGTRYTINLTIQPTYLYMLSEPDLDDPSVVVSD